MDMDNLMNKCRIILAVAWCIVIASVLTIFVTVIP
jgi:hypothetical protein